MLADAGGEGGGGGGAGVRGGWGSECSGRLIFIYFC